MLAKEKVKLTRTLPQWKITKLFLTRQVSFWSMRWYKQLFVLLDNINNDLFICHISEQSKSERLIHRISTVFEFNLKLSVISWDEKETEDRNAIICKYDSNLHFMHSRILSLTLPAIIKMRTYRRCTRILTINLVTYQINYLINK